MQSVEVQQSNLLAQIEMLKSQLQAERENNLDIENKLKEIASQNPDSVLAQVNNEVQPNFMKQIQKQILKDDNDDVDFQEHSVNLTMEDGDESIGYKKIEIEDGDFDLQNSKMKA